MTEETNAAAMTDDEIISRARAIEQQREADKRAALRGFVAGDAFKAACNEATAVLKLVPTEMHLSYLVNMMKRLASDYPA